uniref:Threonyl-tRNA synthetase n=1 Tax=Klebsiella pneumoniae TaxID=573 RepID=A0A8B0SVP2_KLEPN|nr:Threonyl-tRNA synthetase [Klebsiella pneumoniae]
MSEALITESEPLTFTLPDGSLKLVRKGTTLQNVAESIDSSVAKKTPCMLKSMANISI